MLSHRPRQGKPGKEKVAMIAQKTIDAKHSHEPRSEPVAAADLPAPAFWAPLSDHLILWPALRRGLIWRVRLPLKYRALPAPVRLLVQWSYAPATVQSLWKFGRPLRRGFHLSNPLGSYRTKHRDNSQWLAGRGL